jgi:hypothetical protein
MNASRTIGIAAIHGQTYGIISKSHVITDNVKTLGIFIQQRLRIHKHIPKIVARIRESKSLAFNQAES